MERHTELAPASSVAKERDVTVVTEKNGCGTKHFRLSAWLLGIVLALNGGSFVWTANTAIRVETRAETANYSLESRMRAIEIQFARIETRMIAMNETLSRIERRIGPSPGSPTRIPLIDSE